jgi:hypothetical protein
MKVDRLQNTIADIIILIMAIIILLCGYNTISFSYFGTNILSDLVANWKKRPITDIKIGQGSCPPSYEPLYEDIWLGTVEGCFCNDGTIEKGKCSSKKSSRCKTIPPIEQVTLHNWDGVLLCAKRYDKDYLFFSKFNSRIGCGLDDKICSRLDNLGKSYCVGPSEECFVNDIVIESIELNPNDIYSINSNYVESNKNKVGLGLGKILKFSRDDYSGNDVIVDIKSSIGSVCIDPLEKNINYQPYELIDTSTYKYHCTNKIYDTLYDERYKMIDQMDINDYYNLNMMTPLLNSLPAYNKPDPRTKIELYRRGYLGWRESCVKDEYVSPTNINDSLNKLRTLNFYQFSIYVTSMLYFVLMAGLFIYKLNNVLLNNDDSSAETIILNSDAINFVGILIGLLFAILAYTTGSGLVSFFVALRDSDCGDHITNKILFSFGDELNNNISKNFTSLILYIVTMILIPLNLILMNYRNPSEANVEMDNYMLLPVEAKNEENKEEENPILH